MISPILKELKARFIELSGCGTALFGFDGSIRPGKGAFLSGASLLTPFNNTSFADQRIKAAKTNSWESRFKGISSIIEKELIIVESQLMEADWKKRFKGYVHLQSKRRKIGFLIVFIFFIITYSPLFWFMGEGLVIRDIPKKSDAIVVFSGDGKASYQNLSYQDRALDAIKFYKSGYADKVFLSSGREQTISDVDMIKLYLVSRGVPESSI